MPPPLSDGQVTFDDGAPNTVGDMARDVSAFLAWAAEPKLEQRKALGFQVVIYLIILSVLLYIGKQRIWSRIEHWSARSSVNCAGKRDPEIAPFQIARPAIAKRCALPL